MALTYVALSKVTVSSNVSSIQFASISQEYSDLVLKISSRTSLTSRNYGFRFNGSSSLVYSDWLLYGTGTTTATASRSNQNATDYTYQNVNTDPTNSFGYGEFYIPNYAATTSTKCVIADSAVGTSNSNGLIAHSAQNFASTAAITQIDLIPSSDFTSGTQVWLYGIKRA